MGKYQWLDKHLIGKPGSVKDYKEEWGWFRYMVGGKMFAATCTPGPEYRGYGCRELLQLKCEPMLAETLRNEHKDIIPAFYMNKRNWNSIFLDGELPDELLREMCDRSYLLILAKLTKKDRESILVNSNIVD